MRLFLNSRAALLPLKTLPLGRSPQYSTSGTPSTPLADDKHPACTKFHPETHLASSEHDEKSTGSSENPQPHGKPRGKSMAELDEELRLKMEGMAGEGGSAGVEYENGKAEGLKRGVKANMFRVI